jgi:hypothetical protein
MDAQTCINPRVSCVLLFSMSVSTPTLKSRHKPRLLAPTVGLTRSSSMRAMTFQSTMKFLHGSRWFLGSLLFITNRFGDLSLQEPVSHEVIRSSTDRLPPAPVRQRMCTEWQKGGSLVARSAMKSLYVGTCANLCKVYNYHAS